MSNAFTWAFDIGYLILDIFWSLVDERFSSLGVEVVDFQ